MIRAFIAITMLMAGHTLAADERPDTLFQYSTINALLNQLYDGDMTFEALLFYGDTGLGTVNGLDGEMIALDGVFYHARADGRVYQLARRRQTPFAVVKFFAADHTAPLPPALDYQALQDHLTELIENANLFQAFRIDGLFKSITMRTESKQSKPYRPLADIMKEEITFSYEDVEGTLIGFYVPTYMKGLNILGYHFHFISCDRTRGGHVLAVVTGEGTIAIDQTAAFRMVLPEVEGFADLDLSGDRELILQQIESANE